MQEVNLPLNELYREVHHRKMPDGKYRFSKIIELTSIIFEFKSFLQRKEKAIADVTETIKVKTKFFQHAIKLDQGKKAYCSLVSELAARAFEAWVFDEIKGSGNCSQYLVQGVENADYELDEGDGFLYPSGEEREYFNSLFSDLFATMRGEIPLFQDDIRMDHQPDNFQVQPEVSLLENQLPNGKVWEKIQMGLF